jgi:8-oxo-dGTP pyrophosphatase MutT (NUDIX family)
MKANLTEELKRALQAELPGNRAHQQMISYSRPSAEIIKTLDVNPKQSAVLILLYQEDNEWYFPLIKRQEYNGVHSRQISLPGGQFDKGDIDLEYTSLRETHEEIGIAPKDIKVLGRLSEIYIPPSNFLVSPFVGYLEKRSDFIAEESEVDRIIKTSLREFLDLKIEKRDKYIRDGNLRMEVSSFIIDNEVVWGATAMMLNEFRTLLLEKVL